MSTLQIGAAPGESGTTVRRREPAPARVASPYGTTLLVGGYQWGQVDEVVDHSGRSNYAEQRGSAMREDPTALNCEHWYEMARGAGRLLTLRLTDGSEYDAFRDVYARDVDLSVLTLSPRAIATRTMRVSGLYPGRRGGPKQFLSGYLANMATAFSATAGTFATGVTMEVDQFKWGLLTLEGVTRSYVIEANSAAGLLSIVAPPGDPGPAASPGAYLAVVAVTNAILEDDGLAFQVDASQSNPGTEFAFEIWDRRSQSRLDPRYPSLSLDSGLDSYVEEKVTRDGDDGRQQWLTVAAETVGDPAADEMQPADWIGLPLPTSGDANVLELLTWWWARVSPGFGTAYPNPEQVAYPSGDVPRCRAVCTFTSPTGFNVVFEDWEGARTLSDGYSGTVNVLFNDAAGLPHFELEAGGAPMAPADVLTIYFHPVPVISRGRMFLYPHATDDLAGDVRTRLPVQSATATQVTLAPSVDLAGDHGLVLPTYPTLTSAISGPYDMSVPANRVLTVAVNGEPDTVLTTVLVGAAETAAALAADLHAQAAASPRRFWFSAVGNDVVTSCQNEFGASSLLQIANTGMGPILGYVAAPYTGANGSDGSLVALSYPDDLESGRDGVAELGAGSEYVDAFDDATSPINELARENLGLIKVACPGNPTYTDQESAVSYCADRGYMFRGELDPALAIDSDSAAAEVVDNLTGDENLTIAWDSYGFPRVKPFPGAAVAYPMTGAILGMEAKLASERKGYQIAAAGVKASVGRLFERLASAPTGRPPWKAEATLNDAGIQAVQHDGTMIYPNGGENSADHRRGTVWKHKVECVLHIMHLLRVSGSPFEWEDNSPATRRAIVASLIPAFQELYDAGWFKVREGQSFWDVVEFAAGDDENPPAVTSLGQARVVVTISGIVDTIKSVVFTIGTGGVTASAA